MGNDVGLNLTRTKHLTQTFDLDYIYIKSIFCMQFHQSPSLHRISLWRNSKSSLATPSYALTLDSHLPTVIWANWAGRLR